MHVVSDRKRVNLILPGVGGWGRRGWGGGCWEEGGIYLAGCLMCQQHASVSQGRICSDNCMMLQHKDRSCRSTFPSGPVTQYIGTG